MVELLTKVAVDCFIANYRNHLQRMKVFKSIIPLTFGLLIFSVMPQSTFAQKFAKHVVRVSESAGATVQDEPYKSEFFHVRGIPKITVNTTAGDIEVFRNPEIEGVMVDLYLERSFSLWSGKRSLDNFRIILQQQGDHIIASVEDKKSGTVSVNSNIKFHFVVQTPENISCNLRTLNGDIFLENVEGQHFVQNQSGDIQIKNSSGEIRVVSTLGNIGLQNLAGNIYAKTVNGNVDVISNSGEVRIRSVSGNIIASDMNGTLISATSSGDIFADFRSVTKGIYLETLSGNIDLVLPRTPGFDIEGSALRYNLEGLNEEEISHRHQNHRQLNVVIREGDLPVQVSTMSGQLRVAESQD